MVAIAYAHDGVSAHGPNTYDLLFLGHLVKNNRVYFLTFNQSQLYVPKGVFVSRISEPRMPLVGDRDWVEGLQMYTFFLLRSLLFRLKLRDIKPSIVFGCVATKYGLYAALAGFRPLILVVWGSDILVAPRRFFFRFLAKYSLKKADAVIVDSDVQEKAAVQLGCSLGKILKFPWFDLDIVKVKLSRDKVRERLGWPDNPLVISVRSHDPIYGVQHFIQAIPLIIQKMPETRFLIIGKGQLTRSLQQKARELGVEYMVKFLGNIPHEDVVSYMSASDLNVSMSVSDGTSASLLEAMALGVPSVVTNIPGNQEWILDGLNGRLVPTADWQTLAETVVSLLEDANLRNKLGQKAIETVNMKVDWVKNAQAISNLVSSLVRDRDKRIINR